MTELDQDLHEMFRRREEDVSGPIAPPGPVLRRARLRQGSVVFAGTILTAALIAIAIAVFAAIPSGVDTGIPGDGDWRSFGDSVAEGVDPILGRWRMEALERPGSAHVTPCLIVTVSFDRGSASFCPEDLGDMILGPRGTFWSAHYGSRQTLAGLVDPSVDRVIVAMSDGTALETALIELPADLPGAAKIFLAPIDGVEKVRGEFVAYDASGAELARQPIVAQEPSGPTPEIDQVWRDLRAVRYAMVRYYDQRASFEDLHMGLVSELASEVSLNRSATTASGEVSIRVTNERELALVSATESGEVYCIGFEAPENFYYGRVDAQTYDDCTGGWEPTA